MYMYGILKARKCRHDEGQYLTFKAYYCGLCNALGADYGALGRLTVNYDMTFFYMLLDSLTTESERAQGTCPTAPWKKRTIVQNQTLHPFMGAVNLYLAGLKLQDDIEDQGGFSRKVGYHTLRTRLTLAKNKLTQLGVDVKKAQALFQHQQVAERSGVALADYYQTTAEGLAFFLTEGSKLLQLPEQVQRDLAEIGYELGKVIYVMDSFVDYPSDTKNDKFNALAQAFGDQIQLVDNLPTEIRDEVYSVLTTSLARVQELLAGLPMQKNRDLVELILGELQFKVTLLVKNTEDMSLVEQIAKSASPFYLLKHPGYFFKSRAAHHDHDYHEHDRHHHRRHRGCGCCDCEDMIGTAICCDAADCDCDALECLSTGNPCELGECFC